MNKVTRTLEAHVTVLGGALGLMWAMFLVNWLASGRLSTLGVIPRTIIGLRGILLAPFLHGSLNHLVANSVPFLALGWLVMLRDDRHFIPVTVASMAGSGVTAWLLGARGSVHIGASGVIFGYLGFLMLSGWFARSPLSVVVSLLVTVMWGGLVFGVLPGVPGVSWQMHLGGFLGGVLAAKRYRTTR